MNNLNKQKQRIEYLDALRGFTMLLVVFAHVETYMLSIDPGETFLSRLFLSFRMPLFFFISGYLSFKEGIIWTSGTWMTRVGSKIKIQLVPTMVFGALYTFLFSLGTIGDFIGNYHKFGYWFTISLLVMLLILYTTNWIIHATKVTSYKRLTSISLLLISSALFLLKFVYDKSPSFAKISDYFCFHQVCVFFPFFTVGYLASQKKDKFISFLNNDLIQFVIFVLFCFTFYTKGILSDRVCGSNDLLLIYRSIQDILIGIFGICIVYNFFRKNSSLFSKDRFVGRQLQRIGSRTLDIYMLHYFFLTKIPISFNFNRGANMVCELFCVAILAVFTTYCTLLVSDILRTSRSFSYYMFGASKK